MYTLIHVQAIIAGELSFVNIVIDWVKKEEQFHRRQTDNMVLSIIIIFIIILRL